MMNRSNTQIYIPLVTRLLLLRKLILAMLEKNSNIGDEILVADRRACRCDDKF